MNVLKFGDSGTDVTDVQLKLRALGYPLKGTGYFGPATDASVTDFQKRHNLDANGIVEQTTMEALESGQKPGTVSVDVSRPLWLTVALSNIGMHEGKDDAQIVKDMQEVSKDYFHSSTPWCAGYVSYCMLHAGVKPTSTPLWALSYADPKWGMKLDGPALGSIAVKHRQGGGHVTVVAGRTTSGRLACCGGNQGDAVSVVGYPQNVFDGFYWPKAIDLPKESRFSALPIVNASGKVVSEK